MICNNSATDVYGKKTYFTQAACYNMICSNSATDVYEKKIYSIQAADYMIGIPVEKSADENLSEKQFYHSSS